jgi:hypothetical protein
MISQIVLDSDEFQQAFCEGCPAVSVIRGARDSLGVPQDPDDVTCPVDFCPWDEKCFRYQTFEEIEKLLCQVDAFLAEAGSYV